MSRPKGSREGQGGPPADADRIEAARRFRAALGAAGLSQREAARRLNLPQQRVNEWARGERRPDWLRWARIVAALHLDPAILFPELFPSRSTAPPAEDPPE